jgi:predicted transcriptional regulator
MINGVFVLSEQKQKIGHLISKLLIITNKDYVMRKAMALKMNQKILSAPITLTTSKLFPATP